MTDVPSFNLWTAQWLALERAEGPPERTGIEQALLRAHEFTAIYDSSPLVVVGVHRLLTAILQAALNPQHPRDLEKLWREGRFPQSEIKKFGTRYTGRFDVFSAKEPFLQSGELPLKPGKGDKAKTAAYLFIEAPSGTEITHYRHGSDEGKRFCPACAASGLVIIPCFAAAGGAGIKPSINGVPPVYVIPTGQTFFESLTASLVLPRYQPEVASKKKDLVWWERPTIVGKSKEVKEVGYLHSLTFPARRVRLHPEPLNTDCSRCGQHSEWGIRTMVFEMGESRPKDSAFWFDPFAAYKVPTEKSDKAPTPIRPQEGKALWREFASLFLPQSQGEEKKGLVVRPSVLYQIANEDIGVERPSFAFRCVGMRTDMKAKVFEWIDAEFSVPAALLDDEDAERIVREATQFATDCEKVIAGTFREVFRGSSKKAERHKRLKNHMQAAYWAALAAPFRDFVLAIAESARRAEAQKQWAETVVHGAQRAFNAAAEATGDDAVTLRQQVEGQRKCAFRLAKTRNAYLLEGETE